MKRERHDLVYEDLLKTKLAVESLLMHYASLEVQKSDDDDPLKKNLKMQSKLLFHER